MLQQLRGIMWGASLCFLPASEVHDALPVFNLCVRVIKYLTYQIEQTTVFS